ncbi:protein disulfide-isomerase domain [Batrachochytrium salamandrivorans]|nr:protein disulfide-isomerase domain [Batrachochytrium salamandrivorans]
MQNLLVAFLLALVGASSASLVLELNDANFDSTLAAHQPMMIEFYAPALEPEYESAAEQLQSLKSKVTLGKVDVTHENAKELQKRFAIQGFPTLKYFSTANPEIKPLDYEGERTAQAIVKYCIKRSGPSVTVLESDTAVLARELKEDQNLVVGYFPLREHMAAFDKQAAGDDAREYFAVVGGSAKEPSITVVRWFNHSVPASTSDAKIVSSQQALSKFIDESCTPFSHVKVYTADDLFQAKQSGVHLVEFYAPWCGYCKQFAPEYEKVALHFAESLDGLVQVGKLDGTVYEDALGAEQVDGFPTTKLYKNGASTSYKGESKAADVIAFVNSKLAQKIEQVSDVNEFTKVTSEQQLVVVVCVSSTRSALADAILFEFGSEQFKVGQTTCVEGKESVSLYNSKGLVSSFTGVDNATELRKWLKRASIPKVFMFEDELFQQVQAAEYKYLFLAISEKESVPEEVKLAMNAAAEDTEIVDTAFAFADSSADYMLSFFGLTVEDLPAVRVLEVQSPEMTNYAGPQGIFSAKDLLATYRDLIQGKLVKLEPPAQNEEPYEEEAEVGEEEIDSDSTEEKQEL